MSYAIIRNAKYKRENLMAVYRHNERKNKNYSNKEIDRCRFSKTTKRRRKRKGMGVKKIKNN